MAVEPTLVVSGGKIVLLCEWCGNYATRSFTTCHGNPLLFYSPHFPLLYLNYLCNNHYTTSDIREQQNVLFLARLKERT